MPQIGACNGPNRSNASSSSDWSVAADDNDDDNDDDRAVQQFSGSGSGSRLHVSQTNHTPQKSGTPDRRNSAKAATGLAWATQTETSTLTLPCEQSLRLEVLSDLSEIGIRFRHRLARREGIEPYTHVRSPTNLLAFSFAPKQRWRDAETIPAQDTLSCSKGFPPFFLFARYRISRLAAISDLVGQTSLPILNLEVTKG